MASTLALSRRREHPVRVWSKSGVRFTTLVAMLAGLAIWLVPAATAKFMVSLSVSSSQPRIGDAVQVVIRTGSNGGEACRMRLVAIAPGANRQTALDALINGSTETDGPSGPMQHRLNPTLQLGLRIATLRTAATAWRATVHFPRAGKWQLVVPNWCASGYASPLPAVRIVTVR